MPRFQYPELKDFLNKRLRIGLNAKRCVEGTLQGYDQYMNLVLEDAIQVPAPGTGISPEQEDKRGPKLGTIVRGSNTRICRDIVDMLISLVQVVRGNSVVQVEYLEKWL